MTARPGPMQGQGDGGAPALRAEAGHHFTFQEGTALAVTLQGFLGVPGLLKEVSSLWHMWPSVPQVASTSTHVLHWAQAQSHPPPPALPCPVPEPLHSCSPNINIWGCNCLLLCLLCRGRSHIHLPCPHPGPSSLRQA